jgi:pimeloyl-ACP methyl ester carboxylesterase
VVPRPRGRGLAPPLTSPTAPFAPEPVLRVPSPDGTKLAVFEAVAPTADPAAGPPTAREAPIPVLLVHGATADHTTWRAVGPLLAATRRVFALDRRGRGASGDSPGYAIEREYEDLAAAAEQLAATTGATAIDVVGHSYGGRCALGASLLTPAIRRLVVYEGAPVPPGMSYRPAGLVEAVRAALDAGDNERALETFLAGIVGMSEAELAAYRANPVWPDRVAAAHTILREVDAEASAAASLEALSRVSAPVLLVLGSTSRSPFRIGTDALASRLADASVVVIDGAAHAAHHTHAAEFATVVAAFLDRPLAGRG